MSQVSDEKLIKKAFHAHRNLRILAVLAIVFFVLFAFVWIFLISFTNGEIHKAMPMYFMPLLLLSITVPVWGLLLLAKAAKQGDPNSVTLLLMLSAAGMVMNLLNGGYAYFQTAQIKFEMKYGGFLFAAMICWAFWDCRDVLLEIKKRGLQEQAFGTTQASSRICIIGSALLLLPMPIMFCNALLTGSFHKQIQEQQASHVQELAEIFNNEEKDLIEATRQLSPLDMQTVNHATNMLAKLETKVDTLCEEASKNAELLPYLEKYKLVINCWKEGCQILLANPSNEEQALEKINEGNHLRKQLGVDLTKKYKGKK